MPIQITAVICTHNRAGVLPVAIESLLDQSLPPGAYEVIVVDNCSTDETPVVVQRYMKTTPCVPLRSFAARPLGLSHARNLAVQMAAGEVIAFLDDDAIATPQWLAALLDAYAAFPEAWAVGGKVLLRWQAAQPKWLTDGLLSELSMLDLGEKQRALNKQEFLWGTNCSFSRNTFIETGLFRTDLGRRGRLLIGEEETELQKRIRRLGGQVIYAPDAIVHHRVGADRLQRRYFVRVAYGKGRSTALINGTEVSMGAQAIKSVRMILSASKMGLQTLPRLGETQGGLACLGRQAFALGYLYETVVRLCHAARHKDERASHQIL